MAGRAKMNPVLSRLLAIAVGALFVYAGILKVIDPVQFTTDIANFRLLPHVASVALALYLPWLEIFCGAALALRKLYSGALLLLTGMTLVFFFALVSAKARGLDISCGCFGHLRPHPLIFSIVLDAVLFNLLIILARDECRPKRF